MKASAYAPPPWIELAPTTHAAARSFVETAKHPKSSGAGIGEGRGAGAPEDDEDGVVGVAATCGALVLGAIATAPWLGASGAREVVQPKTSKLPIAKARR